MLKSNLMLAGICFIMLVSCKEKKEEIVEESQFLVTNPIEKDTLVYKEYVAQIQSIQHIELRALEKGYLQKIFVNEGQFVHKGQLLFQITPVIYQAETQKAEAELNYTKIEYQNTKQLFDSNIVSKRELALAKAKLDKVQAELSLAKAHLAFTEIRAPFDGIIDRFKVRLGSLLDEGELLTSLSDNSRMWVYFNVPETEYLDYALEQKKNSALPVKLRMANTRLFDQKGVIETIEADFNNETGNIPFRASFPNPKKILRHGETGNILMPVQLKKAMIIPQKASFEILDKKYVFVIDKNHVIQSKQIEVGTELPYLYVVTKGLELTDQVLVDGLRKVKVGQKINTRFVPQAEIMKEVSNLHAE